MSARASHRQTRRKANNGFDGLKDRMAAVRKAGGAKVKIGLPTGAAPYPDGTPVIMVGAVHEFGSDDGSIPERPWLRSSMEQHRDEHMKLVRKLAKGVSSGDRDPNEALELLGTKAAANVQAGIVDLKDPPNTDETVARKGSSNPLIDTGHLRQAVTHQVVKKGRS